MEMELQQCISSILETVSFLIGGCEDRAGCFLALNTELYAVLIVFQFAFQSNFSLGNFQIQWPMNCLIVGILMGDCLLPLPHISQSLSSFDQFAGPIGEMYPNSVPHAIGKNDKQPINERNIVFTIMIKLASLILTRTLTCL